MRVIYIALVLAFWKDGKLTMRAIAGVIKLVPKNLTFILLQNWCLLTMLMLTGKLCAKILANRIKGPTNSIIEPQQTGFLEDHNITNNLLTFKFPHELVLKTRHEALLLKANFMKAYDRVKHSFIWAVMKALGYDPHMIMLAKGLVENAASKVHVNGRFTNPIELERGVRHGCPLSTLLFTILSQPLMLMIQNLVNQGELEGIHIGPGV